MAGALTLAFAVVSSVECVVAAYQTAEQMACCAAMQAECEMTVSSSCCASEAQALESFVAVKAAIGFVPTVALVAVLDAPAIADRVSPSFFSGADTSSSSPPGVPTYLFVSSFRI